jgi:hypothetical protein
LLVAAIPLIGLQRDAPGGENQWLSPSESASAETWDICRPAALIETVSCGSWAVLAADAALLPPADAVCADCISCMGAVLL